MSHMGRRGLSKYKKIKRKHVFRIIIIFLHHDNRAKPEENYTAAFLACVSSEIASGGSKKDLQ